MSFPQKKRAMTPKGQMSGNGSGPAIMMMPPHIRATFMPDPPLKHLPTYTRRGLLSENYITDDDDENENAHPPSTTMKNPSSQGGGLGPSGISYIPTAFPKFKRGLGLQGVSSFLHHFEQTPPPPRQILPTPKSHRDALKATSKARNDAKLAPLIAQYREEQRTCAGEYTNGMNCYNTLFVGRLAYEVTERKLLREMEVYGPIKDIKLVTDKFTGRSRGYAFVEYEHEEDMKRAYRAADGMRLEGRAIVVDVERGHTVPNWLPRKFGGGLGGGTRASGGGGLMNNRAGAGGMMDRLNSMNGPGPGPIMGGGGGGGAPAPPPMYGRPPMGGRGGSGEPPHSSYGGSSGGYTDRAGGGGHYGGPPPSYGDRGGGGGGGGVYGRGPPPTGQYGGGGVGYNSGPPPLAWERGGGARGYDGDRKRRRSRSRSPDSRRRR